MKKLIKVLCCLLSACFLSATLLACVSEPPPTPTSFGGVDFEGTPFLDSVAEDGEQTLNVAVMFDAYSYITYNGGNWDALDGNSYRYISENPTLKPVWATLGDRLNINFVNKSGGATNLEGQWSAAKGTSFNGYDVINGNVDNINAEGAEFNMFVDLKPFLNRMPNLKAFLEQNPFVANTILSNGGKMYYAPYFDGFNDLERMFIMRADWVRTLLDGVAGQGDSNPISTLNVYQPFLPSSLPAQSVTVTAVSGTTTETLSKNATTNIITQLNALTNPTGVQILDTIKAYITARYGAYYGAKPSDLFVGQNASYDADELVALLRAVKANPKLVTGSTTMTSELIIPIYPRSFTNDRAADVLRFASIWGVRGLDTPNGYFFIDDEGRLQDSRLLDDTYYGIAKLNELYREGLILSDFNNSGSLGSVLGETLGDREWRGYINRNNRGFMTYDYNQTTTLLNGLNGQASETGPKAPYKGASVIEGFELTPVLPPFTVWKGKTYNEQKELSLPSTLNADNFYRFTESWRSVKPDGWGIVSTMRGKALERALAMFDYMYSSEGNKLMSYGPDAWIANSDIDSSGGPTSEGKGTIQYMGRAIPKLASGTLTELRVLAEGNYTNYYRRYLGGTMPIGYIKEQGMEYQATHVLGRAGQDRINNAVLTGTLKHPLVGSDYYTTTDKTLMTVPTTLGFNKTEQSIISSNFINLTASFNVGNVPGSAGANLFYKYIMSGFGTGTGNDPDSAVKLTRSALLAHVANSGTGNLNCSGYLEVCRTAYNRIPKNA